MEKEAKAIKPIYIAFAKHIRKFTNWVLALMNSLSIFSVHNKAVNTLDFTPERSGRLESTMNRNIRIYRMAVAALLCAIGIVIPMFSPLKIILEPASFTLGSHVAIFIAMFISPMVAIFVALGTTIGFFIGGFPIIIVLRALTHVIFTTVGAFWLKKHPYTLQTQSRTFLFGIAVAIIHAIIEISIVIPFFFGNSMSKGYYEKGFVFSVVLLVGVGTIVHSLVDFYIAKYLWKALSKSNFVAQISSVSSKKE